MSLPKISNKQQEILKLIYKFRFLNRTQIQTFLIHKDTRRINEWLKDLTEKEYIKRIYDESTRDNTIPAVYYIGLNGIRFLKTQDNYSEELINKLYREKDKSESFINRSILLADICLDLQSDSGIEFSSATSSDITIESSPYKFLLENDLNPSLVFSKKPKAGKKSMTKYYILQLFEPTLPAYSIRKKINNYFDLYFSNGWEDNTGLKFPFLLFIFSNEKILIRTKRYTKNLLAEYDDIDLKVQFTTEEKVRDKGINGNIWE